NDGSAKVSFPAALPTVIAVGAVDENSKKADFSQYGPQLAIVAPGVAVLSTVPVGSGRETEVAVTADGQTLKLKSASVQGAKELGQVQNFDLAVAGLGKPEDFASLNVEGKYVLVSRGEIAFGEKAKNAMAAKAAGILFYNNAPGLIHAALTQDGSTMPIAVALIEQGAGEQLKAALQAGKGTQASIVTLKTDYTAFDGTSMATPHVAGVVALIKAANKNLKPSEVKAILQKTAGVLGPNTNNEYGAGLVNAEAAVNAALGK
ncbi:MAG: S8 family serine peptidase, partial [Bdellovibrionaceae bacterium]|nr:S8 family serine peptidase [Pseudobdellovibrionaceae bacterium]